MNKSLDVAELQVLCEKKRPSNVPGFEILFNDAEEFQRKLHQEKQLQERATLKVGLHPRSISLYIQVACESAH